MDALRCVHISFHTLYIIRIVCDGIIVSAIGIEEWHPTKSVRTFVRLAIIG